MTNAPVPPAVPLVAGAPLSAPAPMPMPMPMPAPAPATDLSELLGDQAARPWYRRPLPWIVFGALLLAAGGVWWWLASRAAAAAPSYVTAAVARGDLTLTVTANGTIQPTRSINIGSELSGTVLQVNVDVNDIVKKGQVLVVLDPAKLRDQVLRSRASLAAAQALVAQTVATVAESRATLARLEDVARVSGGKVPAKTELDTARATLGRSAGAADSALAGV